MALPSHRDCFGNQVHRGALLGAHHSLVLQMDAVVETDLDGPLCCDDVEPARERAWIDASLRQAPRLWDLVLQRNAASALFDALSAGADPTAHGMDAGVVRALTAQTKGEPLCARIRAANDWLAATCTVMREDSAPPASEAPVTRVAHAVALADRPLREARGTPTELALVLMALVRTWGLPARLVSGYCTEPSAAGTGVGVQRWAEVLVPDAGWRGFDPSRGQRAHAGYVRVAVGRSGHDLSGLRQCWRGDAAPPCPPRTA